MDAALRLLNGMFAFALFDKKYNELILARDRVGEKPLYFGNLNKTFFFGSELKALKCHPAWDGEINQDALTSYLRHNYVPAPLSIFKNINKLPAGNYLRVKNFGKEISDPISYWDKETFFNKETELATDDELINELEKFALEVSKFSDDIGRAVGGLLSGGIDSSTIVSLMQSMNTQPVKTFSIGFDYAKYNEAHYESK